MSITPTGAASSLDRDTLRRVYFPRLSDDELLVCLTIADRYGLDPVLKHVVAIPDRDRDGNTSHQAYITRDGLLHLAHGSGDLDAIEVRITGENDEEYVAEAKVWRTSKTRPTVFEGRFPKAQTFRNGGSRPHRYAREMAEKVAVARALKHAFDVSLPTEDERVDVRDDEVVRAEQAPARRPRKLAAAQRRQADAPTVWEHGEPTTLELKVADAYLAQTDDELRLLFETTRPLHGEQVADRETGEPLTFADLLRRRRDALAAEAGQ